MDDSCMNNICEENTVKYTTHETLTGFKIRWFIENCCEIKLNDGRTIVIDPMLVKSTNEHSTFWEKEFCSGFGVEDLEGCDYVLLTHVHGDHISSLKAVYERFHPTILCSGYTAFALAKALDMPPGAFIAATAGEEYDLNGGLKVQWLTGRHTWPVALKPYSDSEIFGPNTQDKDLGIMGSIYNNNFVITLPGNFKIAMDNGLYEPNLTQFEKYRPNLIVKHKERGAEKHISNFTDEILRSGAEYIFSLCHQGLSDQEMEQYTEGINVKLRELNYNGAAVNPKPGHWYSLSLNLHLED
jgi:hypothetical protein